MSVAELYASHSRAVWALAHRRLGDSFEADDIAAATFSLLLTIPGPHRQAPPGPEVRAFVLGVCKNLIRRFRRSGARRREVLARYDAEASRAGDDVERTVTMRQQAERLRWALGQLSAEQRDAVIGSALEDYSAADLAVRAGVPEATVRTRIFHARRKLRAVTDPGDEVAAITARSIALNGAARSRE